VAQACYERATDEAFDWDTVASQFDEAFQEVLGEEAADKENVKKKNKKKKGSKAFTPV
jgi:hypothetical protein